MKAKSRRYKRHMLSKRRPPAGRIKDLNAAESRFAFKKGNEKGGAGKLIPAFR